MNDTKEIILMTTLYEKCIDNSQRFFEYKKCLEINLKNEHITQIVIFFEAEDDNFSLDNQFAFLDHSKIKIEFIKTRPSFNSFFEYANEYYPKRHIVVCNGDIFFHTDSNIEQVTKIKSHKEFWCLTRYDFFLNFKKWFIYPWAKKAIGHNEGGYSFTEWDAVTNIKSYYSFEKKIKEDLLKIDEIHSFGTADSFCFLSPIKIKTKQVLGTSGCDTCLEHDAVMSGFKILNPCLSIISRHCYHSKTPSTTPTPVSAHMPKNNKISLFLYFNSVAPICSLEQPYYITRKFVLFQLFYKPLKKLLSKVKNY